MTVFQIKDAYQVMRALAKQATGRADIDVVDHTGFIDAGSTTLATGTENVLNSIARTIKDVFIVGRPYTGKFKLIENTFDEFNNRHATIHFYSKYNEATGAWNTDLYTNLKDGFDNGTNGGASAPDMWVQDLPKVVELFFLKEATDQKRVTIPLVQLQNAFNDEGTFIKFMNMYALKVQNDINLFIEAKARALVADRIAGTYLQVQNGTLGPECAVDMTKVFQDETNTSYDRTTILTEHLTEFLEIFLSKWKIDSDRLEEYSAQYHNPYMITEGGEDYYVLSHTPKANQRMFYTKELFEKARSRVMPEIFGPEFIPANQGEGVSFWQSNKEGDRYKIACKPALPDGAVSEDVELDYVLGTIFDENAIRHVTQFEGMYSTPIEAAKLYKNDIYHYKFGAYMDYLANSIIYYMSEYGNNQKKDTFTGDGTEDDFVLTESATQILSVTVNGTETSDYTYDADTKTVTFTTAPANKAAIVINYLVA